MGPAKQPLAERVRRHVIEGRPGDCWASDLSVRPGGYPRLGVRTGGRTGSVALARVIVALRDGLDLQDRSWVARHTCDTPACVAPAHLIAGTVRENVADMVERGRMPLGERRAHAKLTPSVVRAIRAEVAAGALQREVAARYGVNQTGVGKIVRGETWTHV